MRLPIMFPGIGRLIGTSLAMVTLAGCGASLLGTSAGRTGATAPRAMSVINASPKDTWIAYPDAPSARFNAAGVAVGFQFFVLGGYNDNLGRLNSVDRFTAFDKWSGMPAMPTPRSSLAAALVPYNRVLAIGGLANMLPLGTTEMFSVEKNTWDTMPDMPTPRWGAGADAYGDQAWVAGGAAIYPSRAFESFSIQTKSWTKLADMSVPREGCVAARIGQRIAVVGGRTPGGITGALELYNIDTGTWSRGPDMPTARSYPAFAVYGHHLFVLGGHLESGSTAAVESYDLGSNSWTKRTPLPEALSGALATKLGERLVVTGGFSNGHATAKTWGIPFPFGKAKN